MANIPTTSWDETSPAGSQAVSLGDDRIREMKTQMREVIAVDHKMASSGNDADNGKHNKVTLLEQADMGTGANGKPILGAQTANSKAELVFTNEDDVDIQITKDTKIFLDNGRLGNNVNLIARNAADGANINLIKANASDAVEIPNGAVLSSSSAPTTDPMIPNKKYVDDQIAAIKPYVKCTNTQTSGTNGGTATSGAWRTCTLNTKDQDSSSIATLSGNQITLPAGTYKVLGFQSFYSTEISQVRLQNITDGSTIILGQVVRYGVTAAISGPSMVMGEFTISGSKSIELQYQVSRTESTDGLGLPGSFGSEIYAQIEFMKLA